MVEKLARFALHLGRVRVTVKVRVSVRVRPR